MAMYSGTLRYVLPPVGEAWTGTDMLGFAIGYLILSLLPVLLSHLGYLAGVYTSRRKNTGSKFHMTVRNRLLIGWSFVCFPQR